MVQKVDESEAMIQESINAAIKEGFARSSDTVVLAAGLPLGSPLATNSIRVHCVGPINS
jgi:pyruvate kinase